MKKRIVSVLLIAFMTISLMPPVARANSDLLQDSNAQLDEIITMLSSIESSKAAWNLSDVDFYNLYIGDPIYTYTCLDEGFQENSKIYPISAEGKLRLLAVDHDGTITVTTQLVEEINSSIGFDEPFSIIYTQYGCYACTNSSCILLMENENGFEENSNFIMPQQTVNYSDDLTLTRLADRCLLPYEPTVTPYSADGYYYYSCNVPSVSQLPYNYICWAACVASIVNYRTGRSLTAEDVAREYFGDDDFNHTNNIKIIPGILREYDVVYSPDIKFPTDRKIYINLRDDYPLYSTWYPVEAGKKNHDCVIFGIDTVAGQLSLMDPWGGVRAVATFDGYDYNYYSVGLDRTYKLSCAAFHTI